nr:hypothetical protein [Methylomarinum sp. Ch1-1]MDP4521143.1 hypothetical protein [Methylomarinum sp. Ch1-1]
MAEKQQHGLIGYDPLAWLEQQENQVEAPPSKGPAMMRIFSPKPKMKRRRWR